MGRRGAFHDSDHYTGIEPHFARGGSLFGLAFLLLSGPGADAWAAWWLWRMIVMRWWTGAARVTVRGAPVADGMCVSSPVSTRFRARKRKLWLGSR
ncbi:hypothetical protein GCM10009574_011940 [Streptomyces asiaticus]|uniref:Uncharacterized protein n=2 Tax=Streptomyces rhizosphaericus TaxID=114699 RepID=A0ABN1S8L3_9ACTN